FEALGDVQDAPEQAQRCRYLLAQQAMSAGEYDEAIALYEACGAYLDAEDGAMQARYAKAAALFDAQEYEAAAKAFAELGSYEDAKQRVTDSEDAWLSANYNSARMDTELGNYAAVIDELAAYYEASCRALRRDARMYESACLRAQELTALGNRSTRCPSSAHRGQQDREEADGGLRLSAHRPMEGHARHGIRLREDGAAASRRRRLFRRKRVRNHRGHEPYPTKGDTAWSACGKDRTLRGLQSGKRSA
ncbi:MAG: hypothetical protein ACLS6G_09615, partial [Christensenellales bacterium]